MDSVDIYLHFHGNAETAMNFYRKVFGGEFIAVQRYGDQPGHEKLSPEDKQKLIHISLRLSAHTTLMATDFLAKMDEGVVPGNNFHICLNAGSEKEADKLFEALSSGGKIEMPMNKMFWGAYFGMCLDSFGIKWMINFSQPK
jgi:PhnB protein